MTAKAVAEDRAQRSRHILCVGYRDTDFVKYFLFISLRQSLELLDQLLQHPDLQMMKNSTQILSRAFKGKNPIDTNTRCVFLNSAENKTQHQINNMCSCYRIHNECVCGGLHVAHSYGVKSIT